MAGIDTGSITSLPNDVRAQDIVLYDAAGNIVTSLAGPKPANAAITVVPASITSVTILALNTARHSFKVTNDGNATLYLAFAATATTAAYTVILGKNQSYESEGNGYTGIITGIWSTANGNAVVTEVS